MSDADREIIYVFKVEAAASNAGVFNDLKAQSASLQDQLKATISVHADVIFSGAKDAWDVVIKKVMADLTRAKKTADSIFADVKAPEVKVEDAVTKEKEHEAASPATKKVKEDLKDAKDEADELFAGKPLSDWEEIAAKMDADLKAAAGTAREVFGGATLAEWAKVSKEIDKSIAGWKKSVKDAHDSVQVNSAKLNAANHELNEGIMKGVEGFAELAKSAAEAGVIGEENKQVVLDTLVGAQSMIDGVRGLIDTWKGAVAIVREYHEALEAAEALREASAAAATLEAAGASGGGSALRDVATGAAGDVIGGRAKSAAAGGGLAARASAMVAPVAAFTAAAVSMFSSGRVVAETFRDISQYGFRGGAAIGSFTDRIGMAESSLAEWAGLIDNRSKDVKVTDERRRRDAAERETTQRMEAGQFRLESSGIVDALESKFKAIDLKQHEANLGDRDYESTMTFAMKQSLIKEQLRDVEGRMAAFRDMQDKGVNLEGEAAGMELRKTLLEKEYDLIQRQAEVTKRLGENRIDDLKKQNQLLDDQLKKAQDAADASKSSYESDLEKYADLDPFKQKRLKDVKLKLDAGKDLNKEEADLASGFNEFKERASKSRSKAAERDLGADDLFSAGRSTADKDAAEVKRIINVKAETEKKVTLELSSSDQLEKSLSKALLKVLKQMEDAQQAALANAVARLEEQLRTSATARKDK